MVVGRGLQARARSVNTLANDTCVGMIAGMTTSRFEEFNSAIAPTVQAMRKLTDAILAVEPRHEHRPGDGSEADEERGFEKGLVGRSWWDWPVTDIHGMGG